MVEGLDVDEKTALDFMPRRSSRSSTLMCADPIKSKDQTFEKFKAFKALKENGIHHQTSAPYVPEQNGVAERANRTIVERARCMLHEQNVDLALWAEAISTSTYLRPFGCKAYAHIPAQNRSKLDAKTIECILVGYSTTSKAYRL